MKKSLFIIFDLNVSSDINTAITIGFIAKKMTLKAIRWYNDGLTNGPFQISTSLISGKGELCLLSESLSVLYTNIKYNIHGFDDGGTYNFKVRDSSGLLANTAGICMIHLEFSN